MKIAGVAGKNHPTLKKGDAIAHSPEVKIELMAKDALVDSSPEGFMYVPMSAKVIGEVQIIKGREGVKNTDDTQYIGSALVKYRKTKLDTDRIFPIKECKIKVHIKDSKNDIGIPDLAMVDYKLL